MPKTLYDKLWDSHVVSERDDGSALLYIDRHMIHEVTSPQAFEGLRRAGRSPWRSAANIATSDHIVPTDAAQLQDGVAGIRDPLARTQLNALAANCETFGIQHYGLGDERRGIVHVIGPELGLSLPGMSLVCGDSHTSTHGALAILAMGIGTSQIEHVLATQCMALRKLDSMQAQFDGQLSDGVEPKDMALALIGQIGTAGASGCAIEFTGEAVRALSMEGRMTLCNMSIEAGARVGLVAVDECTLDYLRGRDAAPKGEMWDRAESAWRQLRSDDGAVYHNAARLDASRLAPQVTWGTSPGMVCGVDGAVPDPDSVHGGQREHWRSAQDYMGLSPGMPITDIALDQVFIGSCTNARLDDLRRAAAVVRGKRISQRLRRALVVPGSERVKAAAEREGLDRIFAEAGMEWREPGCSMCLGMNDDQLAPGERCAATSNRNFEGRQGYRGRTHLVSPSMAAAAALAGRFVDVREWV